MAKDGFSFIVCPDGQLLRDRIEGQLAAHSSSHGAWERHVYWGDEGLAASFWEHLTLQGLFATPKALVVRNAQNLAAADWKKLSESLRQASPTSWAFICLEVAFERGKAKVPAAVQKTACWKFAAGQGWIWESPGLDERSLQGFASAWAQKRGVRFAPGALPAICAALPADATAARNELEKLALAAGADGVISADTSALGDHAADLDIFGFIRAVQSGTQHDKVWRKVMGSSSANDGLVFQFLGMLQREARMMWQLLSGESVRLPAAVLQSKTRTAQQLRYRGIMRMWDLALEAEKGIKSGERSPDQAMEALIGGLLALFAPRRP
ncbi:DNA polymerase III subunit delta [Oleidesulfovibrio alaskensis]|jgi:DNA polymerase-3 subunit delta|uniref:DNA polymerase III subunit delta n=1 Tax=Oleidesulfovibrio alaskensis TaxID=58180 RepID=UPI001A5B0F80|nr:DNA polymerase III subunit delta [Oleidesulfovibrio alaskensis]MBL3581755.1 DNA polymerase III subunit delta [Oleidesulfovibrio alaskensis]